MLGEQAAAAMDDTSGFSMDQNDSSTRSPHSAYRHSRSNPEEVGHEGEGNAWDVEDTRQSLRSASIELTRRGLKLSSKWAAEQLVGLPPPPRRQQRRSTSPPPSTPRRGLDRDGSYDSPPGRPGGPREGDGDDRDAAAGSDGVHDSSRNEDDDLTLYAQTLFDMGEYDRAAFCLSERNPGSMGGFFAGGDVGPHAVGPPLGDLGPHGIFLRAYALYLSGERRKEEEVVELRDPLERSKVTNENLSQLSSELFVYHREDRLDAFGMYVYGMVLKKLQTQGPNPASSTKNLPRGGDGEAPTVQSVLVDSILSYPYNWSAWLDLAEICVENPAIHGEVEAAMAPLSNHWMYHLFLVHVFIEQQQNEQALHLIEGLTYATDEEGFSSGLFANSNYLRAMTAVAYYNMRDFDTAQHQFVELCQQDPLRIDHMDVFSNILYVKESKAELSHLAHSAMRNDKYRPETCCIVGNYYSLKAQHEKAVQYFQRALKLDRTYLSAWTLMGHEFVEMKNTAAAIEAYRRAVDINPRDYRAWYGLGQTYEILNMQLYALFYYRKAAALRPYDARMWCAMGGCYLSLDKRSDAIRSYERAVSNHDREGIATRKLATLYREEGEIEKAAKCYQRHLDLRMQSAGGGDFDQEGIQVDATEAEALLYLAFYHKDNRNFETAARFCSKLLEYPGPEKEEAKALLREIRSRVDNERPTSGIGGQRDASFAFSP